VLEEVEIPPKLFQSAPAMLLAVAGASSLLALQTTTEAKATLLRPLDRRYS
jgi:hypothetical protein